MARKRNANGEGSMYYSEQRQRWVYQVTVGHDAETGKLIRRSVSAPTQREARARGLALERVTEVDEMLPAELTVAQFLVWWMDDVVPLEGKADQTITGYDNMIRLYIVPAIGNVELVRLTPAHVQHMLAAMVRRGLAPNTQRNARSVLRRALRTAQRHGLVTQNVAALVDGVKVPKSRKGTLTPDEAKTLLTHARAEGHEALVTVLLGLGLRKGEALGLRWRDLDLDGPRPTLTVTVGLVKGRRGVKLGDVKANSERTLSLPIEVAETLRRHRAAQAADKLAYGPGWGKDWPAMVFTSSAGTPLDLDRVTRLVKTLAADAGVGYWTPHGMRHTAASILLAQGVDLKVIADLLGHSSIRTTGDIYAHLLPAAKDQAAEAMQSALFS